jgi:hypothetical protein
MPVNLRLFARVLIGVALFWLAAIPIASSGEDAARSGFPIDEKHVFFAPRRDTLFVLVDLYPQRAEVEALAPEKRQAALVSTAIAEAQQLMARPGVDGLSQVRVEFGYIKNMDEYARKDFSSMVRHGYVLLKKDGSAFAVVEDRLDFKKEG